MLGGGDYDSGSVPRSWSARHESWKMSLCIELRARRTGQILPDRAQTMQDVPRAMFNRSSLM